MVPQPVDTQSCDQGQAKPTEPNAFLDECYETCRKSCAECIGKVRERLNFKSCEPPTQVPEKTKECPCCEGCIISEQSIDQPTGTENKQIHEKKTLEPSPESKCKPVKDRKAEQNNFVDENYKTCLTCTECIKEVRERLGVKPCEPPSKTAELEQCEECISCPKCMASEHTCAQLPETDKTHENKAPEGNKCEPVKGEIVEQSLRADEDQEPCIPCTECLKLVIAMIDVKPLEPSSQSTEPVQSGDCSCCEDCVGSKKSSLEPPLPAEGKTEQPPETLAPSPCPDQKVTKKKSAIISRADQKFYEFEKEPVVIKRRCIPRRTSSKDSTQSVNKSDGYCVLL